MEQAIESHAKKSAKKGRTSRLAPSQRLLLFDTSESRKFKDTNLRIVMQTSVRLFYQKEIFYLIWLSRFSPLILTEAPFIYCIVTDDKTNDSATFE